VTRDEIQSQIIEFITRHFELEPGSVRPESKFFDDLDLDSIDAVELVLHLGDLTNDTIEEDDLRKIVTVSDIVDLVVRLRSEGSARAAAGGE
jgi:acyl carrier protein